MEVDWEIEIGPHAPVIEALWTGFVDLRKTPSRAYKIDEGRRSHALAQALIRLNQSGQQSAGASDPDVWTAKCDLWETDPCDPDELNATADESTIALACYIDLLPRLGSVFAEVPQAEAWARRAVERLRQLELRCSRADLVIRQAFAGEREGFGVTAYITACGSDKAAAKHALDAALTAFADAICGSALPPRSLEKEQ
jgi:hypothetical protein